jgi:16S rRNA (cytosine1402-N4)-methyltransferase
VETRLPERRVSNDFSHRPVLLEATVEALQPQPSGRFLDCTLGGGGHSEALLEATGPDGIVVGIDRDPAALEAASARLQRFGDRFQPVRGAFADMAELASEWAPFNGILLDLGVSSPQLDHPERGFSFRVDGPVDMRMDPSQELDAGELIDQLDERGLVSILRRFGEEPRARRIARAVLEGRPWTSTLALASCVAESSGYRNSRTHPATRTFQALRMAVNDELGQLESALDAAMDMLAPSGRLGVISFHSLEDRMVKRRFRLACGEGGPKDPFGNLMVAAHFRVPIRRGISGKDADPGHPRSRSARLRLLEHLPPQNPQ